MFENSHLHNLNFDYLVQRFGPEVSLSHPKTRSIVDGYKKKNLNVKESSLTSVCHTHINIKIRKNYENTMKRFHVI